MMTSGAEIVGKLGAMQHELQAVSSQIESYVKDKQATELTIAIFRATVDHHQQMLTSRDASIEALKAALYNKSSHHAKLNALVKGNLTEDMIKSYKANSQTEALRMHRATTEKNNELYAKEEKAERAVVAAHKKKILAIKEKYKTTASGVVAPTKGPKPSIVKKTKDGQPKTVKKALPTTPRCRFISDVSEKWNTEKAAAMLDGQTEFPPLFAWVKPLWTNLPEAERQPYLDAFKVDVADKKATEDEGKIWVNPHQEAKKQKVENGAVASKVIKKDPKKDSKKDSKTTVKAVPDTNAEGDDDDAKTEAEGGDDEDDDDSASGDDAKKNEKNGQGKSDEEEEEEANDEEEDEANDEEGEEEANDEEEEEEEEEEEGASGSDSD